MLTARKAATGVHVGKVSWSRSASRATVTDSEVCSDGKTFVLALTSLVSS